MTWLRALLAAVLSVLMPGAGHVLVRDWLRAVAFAGLFLAARAFLLPIEAAAAAGPVTGYGDLLEYSRILAEETDTTTQFLLSFIALFAAMDATFRVLGVNSGRGSGADDGTTCPECGKDLDEDLEFCHWCTARLEPEVEADDA